MINAIADLGKYVLEKNPTDTIDMVLDDAYDNGRNKHLLIITFEKRENQNTLSASWQKKWQFKEVLYRELDTTYKRRILYKRGSSKGTDFTPTAKITDDLRNKTFPNKIYNWFKQNKDSALLAPEDNTFLNEIYNSIEEQKDIIITSIEEKLSEINDKSGKVLTVGFEDSSGTTKYIGDYEFFTKFLLEETEKDYKYSKTFNTYSYSNDKVCSICNNRKAEVFGFFTDLKFYNVDKAGMITGGLQHKYAWKNYPVCLECVLNVRNGYNFLKENFNFRFYGLRYYFIPKISDKNLYSDILDVLVEYEKNPKFKSKDIDRLTNDENELFEYLQNESSNLSFDLFFYDSPQKEVLRILAIIEDILPSRLHELFDTKKLVDKIIFFRDAKSKKDEPLCYFNFGIVRNFFPNSKIEGNKDKNFLELTEKIFQGKTIDDKFVIQNIMAKIRPKFARGESIWLDSLKGFMFLLYLIKLKLIKQIEEVEMDKQFFEEFKIQTREELESKVELFFNNFKNFFQTDAHRSIFLIGVLSQYLLNIQQRDRGATPFRSKLKGLKMNAYDISVLLPEIIEKLEEYGKNYYHSLEELASKYLISAGHYTKWRLPLDEINFIFVLGMNLSKYFKIKSEEIEEAQND